MTLTRPFPGSCRVYKDGSTYVAETIDGKVLNTNTTDASLAIQAAINGIPGAATRGYGGCVFIQAGDYQCKTTITAFDETLTYNSVDMEGEGKGTRLNFTPSSALTNGIVWRVDWGRISNMFIQGNSNVVNLIRVQGQSSGGAQNSYGILENLSLNGANAQNGVYTAITGQTGILVDGLIPAAFFWKMNNLDLHALDMGIDTQGNYGHAIMVNNTMGIRCTTVIRLRNGQHVINNLWCQGDSNHGQYGIHFVNDTPNSDAGNLTYVTNLIAELLKTATTCAAVLIDAGCASIRMKNVDNQASDDVNWFDVIDNAGSSIGNNYTDRKQDIQELHTYSDTVDVRRVVNTGSLTLELGPKTGAGGNASIDFHTDSGDGDYRARISRVVGANGNLTFFQTGTGFIRFEGSDIELPSGVDIKIGTGTGTKIGTATNEKIGFYNATPIVQGSSITDISTSATGTEIATAVNALISRLEALGLIATV